jgi:hypothetical protein
MYLCPVKYDTQRDVRLKCSFVYSIVCTPLTNYNFVFQLCVRSSSHFVLNQSGWTRQWRIHDSRFAADVYLHANVCVSFSA